MRSDMARPRLLDLFCGAGGAAMGYYRAGFDVVGVDIEPMPRYPFEFHQGDALEYCAAHGAEFDAIHASPPCQAYTSMQHIRKNAAAHDDLIDPTRQVLIEIGRPFVIENVKGSKLLSSLMLCGTMLGLRIIRHRYFECPHLPLILLPPCDHRDVFDPWHGTGRTIDKFKEAFGIDWMTRGGGNSQGKTSQGTIDQAIPPAYTEFIGKYLMQALQAKP